MRALGENKSKVRISTGGRCGKSADILKEIIRHIEIERLKKCGLGGERFAGPGERSVRIGNVVHAFIVASVLSGLDVVRTEVDVYKVLQGLRMHRSRSWRVSEGEEVRRTHDSRKYGG
jgi:hypothetical protein